MKKDKPIFVYNNGIAYAWCGGRWLIVLPDLKIVDFGSGSSSNCDRKATFYHDILGGINAEGDVIQLIDWETTLDFSLVDNCRFFNNNNDIENEYAVIYHLKNFISKRMKAENRIYLYTPKGIMHIDTMNL